eukprot:gene10379-13942_t
MKLHPILNGNIGEILPLFTRWQSLSAVCFFVSVSGITYAFGVYSEILKLKLGFSQSGLETVASIGNSGLYLSLFTGFALEKFGFRVVVLYGGIFIFVGYMYIWLAIQKIVPADILSISLFYFISQLGVCCHVSSAVTLSVKLFPPMARGTSIGLVKGYFGLSSAVLGDIAGERMFVENPVNFVLFIGLFIPMTGIIGSVTANIIPNHLNSFDYEYHNGSYYSMKPYIYHWCLLCLTLLIIGYIQYQYSPLSWTATCITSFIIFMTISSILFIPNLYGNRLLPLDDCDVIQYNKKYSILDTADNNSNSNHNFQTFSSSLHNNNNNKIILKYNHNRPYDPIVIDHNFTSDDDELSYVSSKTSHLPEHNNHNDQQEEEFTSLIHKSNNDTINSYDSTGFYDHDLPFIETIHTWRFWALFFIFLIGTGSGLMVIYNVNAIAQAANKQPSSFFVTLISLANGFGRLTAGVMSDFFVKFQDNSNGNNNNKSNYLKLSKIQLEMIVIFFMGITQLILSCNIDYLLYPCFLSVGYFFGCLVALNTINVADIFGDKYVATNYGAVDTAPIFSSYIFSTGLVALFYKDNIEISNDNDTISSSCVGRMCFFYPFIINFLCCMIASFGCYILHIHTPMKYNRRVTQNGH